MGNVGFASSHRAPKHCGRPCGARLNSLGGLDETAAGSAGRAHVFCARPCADPRSLHWADSSWQRDIPASPRARDVRLRVAADVRASATI